MINNVNDLEVDLIYKSNNLYLLNKNSKYIKLANNIYTYYYIKNDFNDIDICYIDFKSRLTYISYKLGYLKKKSLCRLICKKNNIKDIKFKLYNSIVDIFLIEYVDNANYTLVHIHYDLLLNEYKKFEFKNLHSNKFCYYMDSNNILIVNFVDANYVENKFYFDLKSLKWYEYNDHSINYNLINYCKNLKYK